jgi:hypothetical protein
MDDERAHASTEVEIVDVIARLERLANLALRM